MAEVEPCESLAGGGQEADGGWQPRAEEGTEECPEQEKQPGQLATEWKELGKKRHRRRPSKKKRRWKPYNKLTWEEKKRLEERESQRAARMRAEMFAKGQPVAPYNTTQFLMEDHDQEEPDLCPPQQRRALAALPALNSSTDEDDDEEASGSDPAASDDGAEFLQKDFSETYEKYHAESLQDMSKQELVREYLELEKCLSRMEDDNNRLRLRELGALQAARGQDGRIRELEAELERLREENRRLQQQRSDSAALLPPC